MRIRKAIILSTLVSILAGCTPKEPAKVEFRVTPETATVDALGGPVLVTVVSSTNWIVNSSKPWVKATQSSGPASESGAQLVLNVAENETTTERVASVTVKNLDMESVTLTITQEASSGEIVGERGISTAADLQTFAKNYNSAKSVAKYMVDGAVVLLNDIDCSEIKEWTAVGTADIPFTGSFDGRGHVLKNVNWTGDLSKSAYQGFFGNVKSATISNLTFGSEGDALVVKGSNEGDAWAGGIVAYASKVNFLGCTNNVSVTVEGPLGSGKSFCLGGISGHADLNTKIGTNNVTLCVNNATLRAPSGNCGGLAGMLDGTIEYGVNNGNVILSEAGRAAGFAAYSTGRVSNCTNNGAIIAPTSSDGKMGPAWGCAYSYASDGFKLNTGYGRVGGSEFAQKPETAPGSTLRNAVLEPATGAFDPEAITVDWTQDSYFEWVAETSKTLHSGVTYTKYICTGVPRKVCVLEIDLSDPTIEITTAYSDDIVPNPNANKNSNNGPKIRETLSQICTRKRNEGMNVLAGINTGFFDSNDGISRGPHIENGEPVYVNNPSVRQGLPNHDWAFTVFTDGTASCGKKAFNGSTYGRAGTFKIGDREFDYSSINDTVVRHVSPAYTANLYTYRYVKTPHPKELPSTVNALAKNAYYLVCEFTGDIMRVNQGYAAAKITAIHDGSSTPLSEGPYVTGKKQFVLALSGSSVASVRSLASVGADIQIKADMAIDGVTKPILTQNSTMFQFMVNGNDNSQSAPATHTNITTFDPVTYAATSQDGKKVWLIEVDGRQPWVSMGLKSYEMYRIAKKLGAWNMTRFDGGGSSAMWLYDQASSRGGLASTPSDSKGERSCMNYILVRAK